MALAVGNVKVGEREIYAGYQFNVSETPVNPTKGLLVLDVNGDGKFDNFPFSDESVYASDEETVFRIEDIYLSTEKLDLQTKKIVMRPRGKSEYKRQEVRTGEPITDFSFIDFDGKKRSLSEFRGKYVLLDFWGVWCVDCRRETPFQIEAYKQFRSRGFEILGMDTDEDIEKAKTYLAQNKITWTQTQFESVKELIEKTFGIQQYPSTLLLAPDGKVLVLDQEKLKGNELLKTLDQILPPNL